MIEPVRLCLDMKCGCGASLYLDWPVKYAIDTHWLSELAKGWTAAHRAHHVEPKPEAK